ncbi:hypothetical protein EV360DRAFT_69421 [Lentinula raphanica]|nr:hypothetical protein EV360DRAFT_69421 [Lentinula raphanica]
MAYQNHDLRPPCSSMREFGSFPWPMAMNTIEVIEPIAHSYRWYHLIPSDTICSSLLSAQPSLAIQKKEGRRRAGPSATRKNGHYPYPMAVDGGLMGHGGVRLGRRASAPSRSGEKVQAFTQGKDQNWGSYRVLWGLTRKQPDVHLSFLELHKRSEKRLFFPIPSKKKTSLLAKEVSKVPRQVLNFQVHITIINVSLAPALQKKTLLFIYLLYISNYKPQSISICIALKMRFDIIRLALSASLVFVVSAVPVPPDDGYTPLGHRYSNSNTGGGKQTTVDGVGDQWNTFNTDSPGRTTATSRFEPKPAGTSGQRNGPSWNTNTGSRSYSSSNYVAGGHYIDLGIPISIQMSNVNTGSGSQNNYQGRGNQNNVFDNVPGVVGSSSPNANSRIDLSIPISIQASNVHTGNGSQTNFQGTGVVGSSSRNANSRIDLSIPISIQASNVNFGSGPQNNFQGTGTSRTYVNGVLFYMWLAQLWEGWLKLYLFSAWSGREQGCNFPQQSRGEECFWMDRNPNVILT